MMYMVNKKSGPNRKTMAIILIVAILAIGAVILSVMATSKSGANSNAQLVGSKQSFGVPTSQSASSTLTGSQASSSSGENGNVSAQSEESQLVDAVTLCASCGAT